MIKKLISHKGEVCLFFEDSIGGPIISGNNEKEAKEKFKKAFYACLIVRSFIDYENNNFGTQSVENIKNDFYSIKEEIDKI